MDDIRLRKDWRSAPAVSGKRVISDVVTAPRKEMSTQLFREPPAKIRPKRNRRKVPWRAVIFTFSLLVIGVFVVVFRSRMEVSAAPRIQTIPLDATLTLFKDGVGNGDLLFNGAAIPGVYRKTFVATEKKNIDTKARGTVVVFNKSLQGPQVLVTTTRLEASGGKIYRIPSMITVPAAITQNDEVIPGSKEIEVVADKAGPDYNIGLVDFTLPAFQGSSKFEIVFARSKTEMTGGATGLHAIVSDNDVSRALTELFVQAEREMKSLFLKKLPPDTFLLPRSFELVKKQEEVNPRSGDPAETFEAVVTTEARGVFVRRDDLEKTILKHIPSLQQLGDVRFHIKNIDQLIFELNGYVFEGSSLQARVRGDATLESEINTSKMKELIVRDRITDSQSVLKSFSELSRVEIRFRPFWFRRAPRDSSRVDIILLGR